MKITCVRHGETNYNKEGVIQGQLDIPLDEKGIEGAKRVAEKLDNHFDIVYSSPLKRAYKTAEIIVDKLNGYEIKKDERLKERDFGDLDGKKWQDLIDEKGNEFREIDRSQEYDYRPYGGESVEDVKNRVESFVFDLKDKDFEDVLIVTHAGIIRVFSLLYSDNLIRKVSNSGIYTFKL